MGDVTDDFSWPIAAGFLAAGAFNILGALQATGLFKKKAIFQVDTLFDAPGFKCIMLWGLAYVAMAFDYRQCPWVVLVFALEKLYYVAHWWSFKQKTDMSTISPDVRGFFETYGLGDALFFVFFLVVGVLVLSGEEKSELGCSPQ